MNRRAIVFVALLFLISLSNYAVFISSGTVRAVEFISIFASGALGGVLLMQVIMLYRSRRA